MMITVCFSWKLFISKLVFSTFCIYDYKILKQRKYIFVYIIINIYTRVRAQFIIYIKKR